MSEQAITLPARPKQQGVALLLTPHMASLLKNNSRRMFPNDGESYCAGWELPKSLSLEVAGQLPTLIADHERHLQPAPFEEIVTRLAQLSLHFWHPDRPKGHTQALLRDYAEDLAEYPADILEEGIRQYRRKGKWFPKVAELREIMEPMLEACRNDLWRLRKLNEIKVREPDLLPDAEPTSTATNTPAPSSARNRHAVGFGPGNSKSPGSGEGSNGVCGDLTPREKEGNNPQDVVPWRS